MNEQPGRAPAGPGEDPGEPPQRRPRAGLLTVGVGASRGVDGDEVLGLIHRVLGRSGHSVRCVGQLATVDAKAGEPGLLDAADRLEVPLRTYRAAVLSGIEVPTPSGTARTAVATPSVAEAAALAAAGRGGRLLVHKTASAPSRGRAAAMATAAVAERGNGPAGHDGCHHGQTDTKEIP